MNQSKTYYEEQKQADPNYIRKRHLGHIKRINSNRERFAGHRFTKQMSAAKQKRKIPWRLDRKKTIDLIANTEQCVVSGRTLVFTVGHPDSPSIDRINSRLGYTKSNIQIVSSTINRAKMDLSDKEFIQLCVDVARHNGY
jgi:hypothetical protein